MNKQMADFGRRLSAAEMKKTTGGIRVGTGSALRCFPPPPPPNCDTEYNGRCCHCCAGAGGALCRKGRELDPFCNIV